MTTTVETIRQTIKVTEVESIEITDIVSDGDGGYVRVLRVFGTIADTPDVPIIELRLHAAAEDNIEITTPELNF
jgi:hypothetical protein